MKRYQGKKYFLTALLSLVLCGTLQASNNGDLINLGENLWSQGKLSEAESAFKNALSEAPDSSAAHQRLASLYLTMNKTKEAISEYQNAITLDSENPDLFIGIAIAYLHSRYYNMAQAMVMQAIELNPELAQAQKLKTYIDAKKDTLDKNSATPAN